MKNRLVLLILLIFPFLAKGQEYEVESFDIVPSDLSARTNSRVDNNGKKCGLIKVYVRDAITGTSGPAIGEVVDRGMEKWVYVSHDAKMVELLFKEHMPLFITFNDYNYPTLTGQMTYKLKLKEVSPAQTSNSNLSQGDREMTPSEMFERGYEADQNSDYSEAVSWYRKAAEQGYAKAQFNLGVMYENGEGVAQDYFEAINWYRKAAEQGNAYAQCNLGYMYENGIGVSHDYSEALNWYRMAAEQGNETAQNNLGNMYSNGYGVAQDYSEALNWYRMAAEQGYAPAQNNLGNMYCDGEGVDQNYSASVRWYRKSAEQGYARAQCNLGYMYNNGYGVDQDYSEAVYWYKKAAEQGNAPAQCNIGYMYEKGAGVDQDYSEAMKWYSRAADNNNLRAKIKMGFLYFEGKGVAKDESRGIAMIEDAGVENIDPWGACQIAEYYMNRNPKKALLWATQAYETADEYFSTVESAKILGLIYLKGGKDVYDYSLAVKYLKEGAELDNPECIDILKSLGEPFEEPEATVSAGLQTGQEN